MGDYVHGNRHYKHSGSCSSRRGAAHPEKGRTEGGYKKAPAQMKLPEPSPYGTALTVDEQKENDAREVFISYLETATDNLK